MSRRLYDFFDGTNIPGACQRYLGGAFRQNWIPKYEAAIAQFAGVSNAVTFGSGRMALYALLEAYGIGKGDEVIIPAFTCVVVPNAILYRGARPVYVDIERGTYNLDVSKIETAITSRTRAIIAQHTFGQPCDIDALRDIAHRHRLVVLEDCAHSFGGLHNGRPMGSFGDAAFVSTDHTKVLSTSLGGFALCGSPDIAQKLKAIQQRANRLSWHARWRIFLQYGAWTLISAPQRYPYFKNLLPWIYTFRLFFYFPDELRTEQPSYYPSRLSNFQAFVGWHEIARLKENLAHRRDVAEQYHRLIGAGAPAIGEGPIYAIASGSKIPPGGSRLLKTTSSLGDGFHPSRSRAWMIGQRSAMKLGAVRWGKRLLNK